MTVFETFPEAIEVWTLDEVTIDTATGLPTASKSYSVHVIVDAGASTTHASDSTAAVATVSTLLYADPADLPTTDTQSYLSGFRWMNPDGREFNVLTADCGKNQVTDKIEHLEFTIVPWGQDE